MNGRAIWIIATTLLAVVVIGLGAYMLGRGTAQTSPTPQVPSVTDPVTAVAPPANTTTASTPASVPTSPVPAETTAVNTEWRDAGCNGTPGTGDDPMKALASATWTPFITTAIPSSPELGPRKTANGVRACYQHSPAGAVMAAVNYLLSLSGPDSRAMIESRWTSGTGKEQLRQLGNAGQPGTMTGFRLVGCAPSACNVELVSFGSGLYAQISLPLIWNNGDWLANGAIPIADAGAVPNLPAGFLAWGPTR